MAIQSPWKQLSDYMPLASKKTGVTSVEEHQVPDDDIYMRSRSNKPLIILSLTNMVMFLLTATMLFIMRNGSNKLLNAELQATSSYSPVFDMIDLEPSIKKLTGSLHPNEMLSIARQFPNPEADSIWDQDIELIRPIPITRDQILKMGKNRDTVAKLEDHVWGLGDDAYVAALDVFHNLHCLNSLRQAMYSDYYDQRPEGTDRRYTHHLNHFIGMLFQTISCSNNVNLVTRHWKDGYEYPFPDCSINKHCVNLDKLIKWHKEASIDMKKYIGVMRKPEVVKEEPRDFWNKTE